MDFRLHNRGTACVIIVGHSGVGKTTLAKGLQESCDLQPIELGLIVRGEAEDGRRSFSALQHAEQRFSAGESTRFASAAVRLADSLSLPLFVGPRRPEEVQFLSRCFGRSLVLGLHAGAKVRHSRKISAESARGGLPPTEGELHWRDFLETRWGMGRTLRMAKYSLDGNASVSEVLRMGIDCVARLLYADNWDKSADAVTGTESAQWVFSAERADVTENLRNWRLNELTR